MYPATLETMPNGARLVLAPDQNAESATFAAFVASGSRHEPAALGGISHFIEHMLFKGTPKRTALEISQTIEGRGGNFNAATNEECTFFYATMPCEFLPAAVDIISDMYMHASIPENEFERERNVILEEMKMYDDDPASVVDENLSAALFKGHPLARPIAGTPKTLAAITPEAMRKYMADAYVPSATVLVASGRFDPAQARSLICSSFGELSGGRAPSSRKFSASTAPKPETTASRDIQQEQLAIGFRAFGNKDPRRWTLSVMDAMMGRGMSSRLFQSIREKRGLSYDIHTTSQLFSDTGAWAVFAGLDPANEAKALDAIEKEFVRIKTKKPSAAEVRRTKDYLEGSFRLGLESPRSRVFHLGPSVLFYDRIIPVEETTAMIEAVTPADIMEMANEIIRDETKSVSRVIPGPGRNAGK